MPVQIEIKSTPTFRDLAGRFARAEKNLLKIRRDITKPMARRLVDYLRDEAPERTGKYKRSFRFRSFSDSKAVGFRVYMPEPLTTFIVEGTVRHDIPVRNAKALRFFWENGPQGPGIYYYVIVDHPGTAPNKFPQRAMRKWRPTARVGLRRISLRYIEELRGKGTQRTA